MSCRLPADELPEHGQDSRFCPLVFLPLKVSMDRTALRRRFPSKTAQRPLEIPMIPPPVAAVGIGKPVRSRPRKHRPSIACIGHAIRRIPSNFFVLRTLEARRARFRHRRGGRREPFPQVAFAHQRKCGLRQAPNTPRAFAKRKNCLLRADSRADAPRQTTLPRQKKRTAVSNCGPRIVQKRGATSSGAAPACR